MTVGQPGQRGADPGSARHRAEDAASPVGTALRLGCIADDFTGATDLANNLVRGGMRVVQTIGVPAAPVDGVDAVVVARKSRPAPVAQAVAESLAAARWLRGQGAPQIFFKVCSTFDSTPQGNIGPVAEALLAELDADFALVTPAFPEAGRTVFKGHLFVGDQLLSDSPMRQHPLTPMTDANLVRLLQVQCRRSRVGLVEHRTVARGAGAVRECIDALRAEGCRLAIADAVDDADLHVLAQAAQPLKLVVAGSGLAIGMPALHGLAPCVAASLLPPAEGARAVVSGSCSAATNAQVADFIAIGGYLGAQLARAGEDVTFIARNRNLEAINARGLRLLLEDGSQVHADTVRAVQAKLGSERAGALVEHTLARVAAGLVDAGVRQLVVAGGETSGACVQALGITQLRIGAQIDPGVPWCFAAERGLHLALKSGNFGGLDFFRRAFASL